MNLDFSMIVFAVLVSLAAATGSIFRPGEWYASLKKPAWTPPNRAFPIVWGILYIMIAVAGWMVWRKEGFGPLLALWLLQLLLNMAWSWIFFGRRNMAMGLVDILALIATIITFSLLAFHQVQIAALLFVPYLLWVTLAAALNYSIWSLNSGKS